jgi:hypothetical protein
MVCCSEWRRAGASYSPQFDCDVEMKRTIVAALVLLSSAATVADFDIDAYCKEAGAGGPAAAAGTSLITN